MEEDIDLEQQYFIKHGWDMDLYTRKTKTPEQTSKEFNADPDKFREELKKESLTKKVKKAFDNSIINSSVPRMFSPDDDISEVPGIGTPENNTQYVTVSNLQDLESLLEITQTEWRSRRNTDLMNYDQRKKFGDSTGLEARIRMLRHEEMHFNVIDEYQKNNPEKVTDVKFGVRIQKNGFDEFGQRYEIEPFVTFTGSLLRTYIEMVAAPDDLSETDMEKLRQIQANLQNRDKMFKGEDLTNPQDREKIYLRWEQEK